MTRQFSALVVALCTVWLIALPAGALYALLNLQWFGSLAAGHIALPIQWFTVETWQWLSLWALTMLYLSVGLAGVWNLRRAFSSFARGDWFNADNSRHLRRCAALMMLQGLAKPVHFAIASVLLSLNHESGSRVLSIKLGSGEVTLVLSGFVLWVLADLLLEGVRAHAENRQFV